MKTRLFKSIILSVALVAVLASCKKVQDIPQQYLRGGNSLVLATDGNLVIAGYNSSTTQGYQATLVKASSSNGDTIWSQKYGGVYSDAFFNVKKSNAGGYIATGFSNRANGGSPSMLVVITDAAGKQLQLKTYGGSAYTQGMSVLPDANADSGYIVAGYIQKSSSSDKDIYLVRIANDGTEKWSRSIGAKSSDAYSSVNDVAYSIIDAPGGGYFLTGMLNGGYHAEDGKVFLMKVSATGDSLWTKTYNTGIGYSLALTHDGGVADGGIAIGGSLVDGYNQDVFLLKTGTDSLSNLFPSWSKVQTFGGPGFEYGATLIETSGGGFAITGTSEENGGLGSQDVYFILTDKQGGNAVEKIYGGTDIDQGYGLIQSGTDFYITGLSNTGGSFIFLDKINQNGEQLTGWPRYIP